MSNAQEQLEYWLSDSYFDDATKQELLAIRNNTDEVEDRFYKELEFGTGGLRGVIGAGTNRMNIYTVRKATQGLANYIKKMGGEIRSFSAPKREKRKKTSARMMKREHKGGRRCDK